MTTMYEHVGGEPAIRRFAEHFHGTVLRDALLEPLFAHGSGHHVDHLTAFFVEMLGGSRGYSDKAGGFGALMLAHLGRNISDEQGERFVALLLAAADATGLPPDERFREALAANVRKAAGFSVKISRSDTPPYRPPYPELSPWQW
ncbi:globin [Kitasatospora sp. NPDC056138]|uniref:globin domain-containing protein n=1 Tax=Kitasatospora sp. NPDC056138 TaxID=3345724 RepID=UPI0035D88A5A